MHRKTNPVGKKKEGKPSAEQERKESIQRPRTATSSFGTAWRFEPATCRAIGGVLTTRPRHPVGDVELDSNRFIELECHVIQLELLRGDWAGGSEESESTSTLPIHCCRSTGRAAGERRDSTAPQLSARWEGHASAASPGRQRVVDDPGVDGRVAALPSHQAKTKLGEPKVGRHGHVASTASQPVPGVVPLELDEWEQRGASRVTLPHAHTGTEVSAQPCAAGPAHTSTGVPHL